VVSAYFKSKMTCRDYYSEELVGYIKTMYDIGSFSKSISLLYLVFIYCLRLVTSCLLFYKKTCITFFD